MNEPINDGGPAFPGVEYKRAGEETGVSVMTIVGGMTLRQYAAIKLCVPDSGLPWLDEMIVQSNRERLAAAALPALVTAAIEFDHVKWDATFQHAYFCADAMLKAKEAK